MTVHVSKTSAGATNLTLQTYCWGAGCTLSRLKMNSTLSNSSLTETTRSVQAAEIASALGTFMNIRCDSSGNQNVAIAAGTNNIGDVDVLTLPGVAGTAAHDAAISGNPVRIGARALTADFTAVAAGDTVDLAATTTGKLINYPFALPGSSWSYAAASGGITNTTGVTIKASGGAGVRNYVTCLTIVNAHTTVGTDVQIRDGASGTVLHRFYAMAAGGGVREMFNVPLRGTAATLLEVACGTTGAAVYVNAQGFTAAE